ncbi:MAG TPA: hypothetical protein DF774_15465 [Rheinheimera sp.]|nr:hypothetical protein [Rheinheimera sp.]
MSLWQLPDCKNTTRSGTLLDSEAGPEGIFHMDMKNKKPALGRLMGENGSKQANNLACAVFTRRAPRDAGGRKNTKTPGAFLDSFSWSRRDFSHGCGKHNKVWNLVGQRSWSRRDFLQGCRKQKTCSRQV